MNVTNRNFSLLSDLIHGLQLLPFIHVRVGSDAFSQPVCLFFNVTFGCTIVVHLTGLSRDHLVDFCLLLLIFLEIIPVFVMFGLFGKCFDVFIGTLLPFRQVKFLAVLKLALDATKDVLEDIIAEVLFEKFSNFILAYFTFAEGVCGVLNN